MEIFMNFLMSHTFLSNNDREPRFEVTPIYMEGVPYYLPSQIGHQLGYPDISNSLRHSSGYVEGIDYKVIEGANFLKLKELLQSSLTTPQFSNMARSTLLLTESGVYAITLRSNKPGALKFRIFYTTKVIPEVQRTGNYSSAKRLDSPPSLREEAKCLLRNEMEVAALLKCPAHFGMIEAIKTVEKDLGVDYSHLLAGSSIQNNIKEEEIYLEPTELAANLGILTRTGTGSGAKMNKLLLMLTLQRRNGRNWVPTKAGKKVSQKHSWKAGGKSGYNLKWNLKAVRELYKIYSDTCLS